MGTIVSSIVFEQKDRAGNPRTEAWVLWEFQDANYAGGGESLDLSTLMQRVEMLIAQPVSGALALQPQPAATDFPADAGSGRLRLMETAMSGVGISITSGTLLTTSGEAGVQSGFAVTATLFSGAITDFGREAEIRSGTAVSGTRAYLHVLGY